MDQKFPEWKNTTSCSRRSIIRLAPSYISSILQRSVLGPTMIVIFINDLPDMVQSQVYLFADDTKIYNTMKSEDDKATLQ